MRRKVESVAALLRSDREMLLERGETTVGALARRYNVAYVTMWKALQTLSAQGAPLHNARKAAQFSGEAGAVQCPVRAEAATASRIRDDIVRGVYETGSTLPKIAHFTLQYRVSRSTVIRALHRLEDERLCVRVGRSFRVGPPRQPVGGSPQPDRITSAPLVLVFAFNESSALHFHRAERSGQFVKAFYHELEKFGVQTTVLFPDPHGAVRLHSFAGAWDIAEMKRAFGERTRGVLVIAKKKYIAEWDTWMERFCALGKPVVWFDGSRENVIPAGEETARRSRRFYRCTWDDNAAVRAALTTLYDLGHRHVGFPNHIRAFRPWIDQRINMARHCAQELNERAANSDDILCIYGANDDRFCADLSRESGFDAVVDAYRSRSLTADEERLFRRAAASGFVFRREAAGCVPSVVSLLHQAPVTALLLPNDSVAMHYMAFCSLYGLGVPRDISLLSFDNSPEFKTAPVSTIDFGMGYLGYAAAQRMLGFVPVRADSGGTLAPQCYPVHRGSLGPPARLGARARLGIGSGAIR